MVFVSQSLSDCLNLLEEGSGSEEADIEELSEDDNKQTILLFGSSLVKSLTEFDDEEYDRYHMDTYDDSDISVDVSDMADMEQNMHNTEARSQLGDFLSERLKTRNKVTSGVHSWSISRLRTASTTSTVETTATPQMPFSTTQISSSPSPSPVSTTWVTTSTTLVTQSPQEAETVRLLASTLSPVVTTSVGQAESSVSLDSTISATSTEEPKSPSKNLGETGLRNVNTTLTPNSVSQTPAPAQIEMTTKSSIISLQQDEIEEVENGTLVPQPVLQTSTPSTFQTEVFVLCI